LDKPRQWHLNLTYALWADRTTAKVSIGTSPFQLLFGQQAVLPIELQLTSFRLAFQQDELEETALKDRYHTLLALDEQRDHALQNIQKRQQVVKKYFDKKAKIDSFKVGQKVLLWDSAHAEKGKHTKFQKLWIGPYTIHSIVGQNSYLLSDSDSRLLTYTTNGSHLKPYYDHSDDHDEV